MSVVEKKIVLTQNGYQKLRDELDHLISIRRKEVAKRLREAKGFGDLSENAEYEDAKNEQAFVEGRIKEIRHILTHARVVDEKKVKTDKVRLGLTVALCDLESGRTRDFKIVGTAEVDPDCYQISNESPVGKAVLGKKVGDIVEIEVPQGTLKYRIEAIRN